MPVPPRPQLVAIAVLGLACGSPETVKLPSPTDFRGSVLDTESPTTDSNPPLDSAEPTCPSADCTGCCDETDACVDILNDGACAAPGEDCRDCTVVDRTCAPDAMCVRTDRLDAGAIDDRIVHIRTMDDALQTRRDLLTRIFGTPALPSLAPTTIISPTADPFEVADDSVRVERLELELPGDVTTPVWALFPENPSGQLVVVHQGHWHTLKEGRLASVASVALARGDTVIGLTMPLFGDSVGPVPTHDDLIARFPDDTPGHGAQVFLTPVAAAIDYVTAQLAVDTIVFVGISGGGWTGMLYAAIDPRVDVVIPIAGGEPLYQRTDLDWGDREQSDTHLYEVAGYLDLFVLGTLEPGRRYHMVQHRYDTCCFAGTGYQDWEPTVRDTLAALDGGDFRVVLDESIHGHEVSPHTLAALVEPALAGDSVRYFDDTLPAYGVFEVDGDWTRDGSSGFGADAATTTDGTATWRVSLPTGAWTAALTWASAPDLSTSVEVQVSVDDDSWSAVLDQTTDPAGRVDADATWQTVASGTTSAPAELSVTVHSTDGRPIRADALRVEAAWSP